MPYSAAENREKYECAICHTKHSSIEERNTCERECLKKQKIEAEKTRKALLDAEKQSRKEDIEKRIDELWTMIEQYTKDYGEYRFETKKGPQSIFALFPWW